MKVFFSLVSLLVVLLALGWIVSPEGSLAWWGVRTDATGIYMARRYGASLLGYAAILWLGRSSGPSAARTAILGGSALVAGLITVFSLAGVLSGTLGPRAWVAVGIEAALTAGFAYQLLAERTQTDA